MHLKSFNNFFLLSIFSLLIFTGCKEEEITPKDHGPSEVNAWIYDVMDEVYLWTDNIPSNVDNKQEPQEYFEDLLYSGDRFSILVPDYEELINSLNGVTHEAGYEFTLAQAQGDDVVAIITYIKGNSPAENTDLKRGDLITHLNGTKMTVSNYQSVLGNRLKPHTVTYSRFDESLSSFVSKGEIEMNTVALAENPNHTKRIITSETGKKVGYFVYNFFSPGSGNNSTAYDDEMRQVFADFKSEGVNEIVLDLRYNSGGSLSSAVTLGSLLGQGVDDTKVFSENRWNNLYQNYIEGLADGDEILRRRFVNLSENIGNNLASGKIYVLTGKNTASASELVINGLSPYMDIHIIGEKTVGKNVGSIPIEDDENENNPIGLLPIVFKTHNSLGQSNYEKGFTPATDDLIDEIQFPMYALGDEKEPLLARALDLIDGTTSRTAPDKDKKVKAASLGMEVFSSSLDYKIRTNRIIFD